MEEQDEQDDDWDRHAEQPEQDRGHLWFLQNGYVLKSQFGSVAFGFKEV
jgi:hypothetical protein